MPRTTLLAAAWLPAAAAAVAAAAARPEVQDTVALLQTRAEPPTAADTAPEALWRSLEAEAAPSEGPSRQVLVNFGDAQYVAYMTLGRQMIAAILDTGSFDLVVFGTDCRACGAAAHYNHHLSRTYWESPDSVEQYYGSGRAISNLARERVAIGPFRIANQSLWNVKYAQMPVLNGAAFEAVFGLGPPDTPMMNAWASAEAAVAEVLSYYDQGLAAPESTITSATKAVEMAKDATNNPPLLRRTGCTRFSVCLGARQGADGLLVWNDDAALERQELFAQVPVVGNHSWSVELSNAGLGGEYGGVLACKDGCQALVDSGTSILSAPTPVVQGLKAAFMNLRQDCTNLEVLPHLQFELGGVRLSLPPDSYVAMVVSEHARFVQEASSVGLATYPGWQCQLLIRETDVNATSGPLWILGMPFFRRYYTTFDLGTGAASRMLYVAPHTQDSCEPTTAAVANSTYKHELRTLSLSRIRFR